MKCTWKQLHGCTSGSSFLRRHFWISGLFTNECLDNNVLFILSDHTPHAVWVSSHDDCRFGGGGVSSTRYWWIRLNIIIPPVLLLEFDLVQKQRKAPTARLLLILLMKPKQAGKRTSRLSEKWTLITKWRDKNTGHDLQILHRPKKQREISHVQAECGHNQWVHLWQWKKWLPSIWCKTALNMISK